LIRGTSSLAQALVVAADGRILAKAQQETQQYYPRTDWVEHDPQEILDTQFRTARQAIEQAGLHPQDIHAIGITNQRETTVLWDRQSGQALHKAIVWQDRRAEDFCAQLREQGVRSHPYQQNRPTYRCLFFSLQAALAAGFHSWRP
jgi:glycerol kinase